MKSIKLSKILFATLLTISGIGIFTGCNQKEGTANQFIDYAHTALPLELDYKGRDFFKEGVGEVKLFTTIDGDTAHFTPVVTTTSRLTIKARFYGIDTPESTGRVQPYGKQASNFTKEKLKNAAANGTIVLAGVSSAYGVPSTDANGRYLSCVWINETIKNCKSSELVNLNLWITQEGLCDAGSLDKMPEYADIFQAALEQAKKFKLKMFSGEPDELYNYGEYEDTYIPDICKAVQAQLKDPSLENPYDGAKVRVRGTVVGYSNNTLFLQKADIVTDEATGKTTIAGYYSINIFCGMTAPKSKYIIPNTVLQLCGIAQDSEEFGFQLTGVEGRFPTIEKYATEDDVQILVKASENTDPETILKNFNMSASELNTMANQGDMSCLNSVVELSGELTVRRFKPNQENKKWTISFYDTTFQLYLTSAPALDPTKPSDPWDTDEEWVGKTIRIKKGIYTYHSYKSGSGKSISYQLIVTDMNDLEWVRPAVTE